jgi:hypothetical protein
MYAISYLHLTTYIYITRYGLITIAFLLLFKSNFTTNAQNVLHLNQCTDGDTPIMDCRTHSQVSGL